MGVYVNPAMECNKLRSECPLTMLRILEVLAPVPDVQSWPRGLNLDLSQRRHGPGHLVVGDIAENIFVPSLLCD